MTDARSKELGELLTELEAAWETGEAATPETLLKAVERRQPILDRLAALQREGLSPAAKEALQWKLSAVRARDNELLGALTARLQDTARAQEDLLKARRVVRGYRAGSAEEPEQTKWVG